MINVLLNSIEEESKEFISLYKSCLTESIEEGGCPEKRHQDPVIMKFTSKEIFVRCRRSVFMLCNREQLNKGVKPFS